MPDDTTVPPNTTAAPGTAAAPDTTAAPDATAALKTDDDAPTEVVRPETATPDAPGTPRDADTETETVFEVKEMTFHYGGFQALREVDMDLYAHQITALIGPSGCGKTTFLRCLNRMNDLIPGTKVGGSIRYHGEDLYGPMVRPIELRRKVGMVFQRPNPFPKSIWENIAFTPRANGVKKRAQLDEIVEGALRSAALWDEVKDKLKASAFDLSGGQQQRLCIARAVAVKPDVILMDEPCAALDPIATIRIEELMTDLKKEFTIIIVTHNMQQAARVSDRTAFFTAEPQRGGVLVEIDRTDTMFTSPSDSRTEDYITGRFG